MGFLWSVIKEIKAPFILDVETELLCTQGRGIGLHLAARGNSHNFSRVVARTWGIFLSYDGEGPSRHVFVQRRQDSCLGARDTSGFSSSLAMAIGRRLHVRRETQGPFPRATGILGLLSIFKRSQASSSLEALISVDLSNFQRM